MEGSAARHVEKLAAGAVDIVGEIEDALTVARGFNENRAGSVAKEHASRAIFVVQDGSHLVAADDQSFLVRARTDELRADSERVDETGASCGEVEAPGILGTDALLNEAGCGGKEHVRGDAGKNDEVDLRRIGLGLRK